MSKPGFPEIFSGNNSNYQRSDSAKKHISDLGMGSVSEIPDVFSRKNPNSGFPGFPYPPSVLSSMFRVRLSIKSDNNLLHPLNTF